MTQEDLQVHIAACERNVDYVGEWNRDAAAPAVALRACQLLASANDAGFAEQRRQALALVLRIGRWGR